MTFDYYWFLTTVLRSWVCDSVGRVLMWHAWAQPPNYVKLDMMVQLICDPRTQEVSGKGSGVQDLSQLYTEFKASLGYIIPYLIN